MCAKKSVVLVVTGARPFIDIDAFAGCVAAAELYRLQGAEAVATSSSVINGSVTQTVWSWNPEWHSDYAPSIVDRFVIIDVSDPDFLDKRVDAARIDRIIDHHSGFETYWQQRLSDRANIDFIGAACTLVFEAWQSAGLLADMSETSARLLATGIIDNTLNFKAQITSKRDIEAYAWLSRHGNLAHDWPKQYLEECQHDITNNLAQALQDDTKPILYPGQNQPLNVGQLALWDAKRLLNPTIEAVITRVLATNNNGWYANLLSINENRSYFFTTSATTQAWLTTKLGLAFNDNVAVADRLWLRKEIMRHVQQDTNL